MERTETELNQLTVADNDVRSTEVPEVKDESHLESEIAVIYGVDETPPFSICLLLGFQVSVITFGICHNVTEWP